MALYKYPNYLTASKDSDFDKSHRPGSRAPYSGIYRCVNCNHEAACNKDDPLPPEGHATHSPSNGRIEWQLIVFAQHKN